MAPRRRGRALVVAWLMLSVWMGSAQGQPAPVAVIVNPGNATSSLSSVALCDFLLGDKQRWPSGGRVQVLAPPAGSMEWAAVVKSVCRMSEGAFARQVNQRRALGRATRPPQVVPTPSDMKALVAGSANALGFVAVSQLDGTVKALAIDNLLPTAVGYPIATP